MAVQIPVSWFGERIEEKEKCVDTDRSKGHSELFVTRHSTDCLDESSSVITSLSEVDAWLTATPRTAYSIPRLAFAFRQLTCSYVLDRPQFDVRRMTLQLLELHVHRLYKGTPVAERWMKICDLFRWKENWDTDEEIPPVVQYVDDRADEAISPYDIDLDETRGRLEETRDHLKQLSSDDCACMLLDKLKQIMDYLT